MAVSAKFVRRQLEVFKSVVTGCPLETARIGQNKMGELMAHGIKKDVSCQNVSFADFEAVSVTPKDDTRDAVMLYLHGGGYCSGDMAYTRGVASLLAVKFSMTVFAPAYRLAPEHKFPCALDDSFEAYKYLLSIGYSPKNIVLCGESAGGGLSFSLCYILRELKMDMPAGIVAFSPWTDLTASGSSYEKNKAKDPSMTSERLRFFAENYTDDVKDHLVSPLFGDVTGFPATFITVGGDEIMLDDALLMHSKLTESGVRCELTVAPQMWHAYVLYNTKERSVDYESVNRFLTSVLPRPRKLRWMKLDNAAKIYPAARTRSWSNVFRLSADLKEDIDVSVMQTALDVTVRRFPSIAVRLCKGAFWYYLEEIHSAPAVEDELAYPVAGMGVKDLRKCALRARVYKNRVACEFFHSLTDGNGGLLFLKTLLAEYLEQKHGIKIPYTCGVLDRRQEPDEAELEDSFLKYSGNVSFSRNEPDAYRLRGTKEEGEIKHALTFTMSTSRVHSAAKSYNVSITAFLCAALMQAIIEIQEKKVPNIKKRKQVKILLPVNLRKLFGSVTLRNFVLYITPSVDPQMGDYTFEEICRTVYHQMGMEITPKRMCARFTTNVNSEKYFIIKIMPLFIKNFVMKMVFNAVGERKSCLTLSNLGLAQIPEEMKPYVERFDFVLSPPASTPYNAGVISYGDDMILTFTRNTKEPELEAHFTSVMKRLGIDMKVESNDAALPERS